MKQITNYAMSLPDAHGITDTLLRTLTKFANTPTRLLTLLTMVMMLAWGNSAWAATVEDLVAVDDALYPSGITVAYPTPQQDLDSDPTPDPVVEFEDFELDLRNIATDNYQGEVPAGLTILRGTSHKSDHGFTGFSAEVVVDGPVKITLGGCQYANGNPNATIAVKNGANLATLNI